jgi:colanic acid biosynthesis glycosyl transferase WcaI
LEVILETAKELRNETAVIFVLIGDGLSKKALMAEAERSSLTNVLFLPFQPRPRLPEVMACANLSLVPLRKGIDKGSLPSKLLTVMASARPVLACVEKDSEMWKVVEKANAGIHVPPEDPTALANTIRELSGNPDLCERLGRSGRLWVENNHTPQAAGLKFERMLSEAIQGREKARRK